MKQILLMIAVVAVVGCGKKEPVQPSASNTEATKPEKERGKEATQPTPPDTKATKPEPTKAKATGGVKLWEFETGFLGEVASSPAIGSDGTVYVGSMDPDNKLYAINGKSGVKLWEFKTGGSVVSSPAIGSDGTLYVGSVDYKLYAIKTDSKGLAKSPWPMRGQNARHTGRVMKK
jgi:predicted small lipoprotein YifL